MTENFSEPSDEKESIQAEVPLSAEEEMQEYKDKYLRLLAELDNTRKRMQKEKQEMTRFSVENALSDILDPLDNLENALKMTENLSAEMKNWAYGFSMILGQFKDALSQHGVTSFQSEGQVFDPRMHYAIETEEKEPVGIVLQEYVKGYRSGDRIIRPARVKVSIAPQVKNCSDDSTQCPTENQEMGE